MKSQKGKENRQNQKGNKKMYFVTVDNFVINTLETYHFETRYEMDEFLEEFKYDSDEEEVSVGYDNFGMFLEDYYCARF